MHRIILSSQYARDRAHGLVDRAPPGFVMSIAEPKRTSDQNSLLWALLTDVSVSKPSGRRMVPGEWKSVFMQACGWECQFLEGLDGRPFPMGHRSSELTKSQMSSLVDFIQAWGSENGVRWSNEEVQDAA